MNESAFAAEFREVLKALEPGAVIFRHVEQFSRDVPDTSVTLNDRTIWIECKRAFEEDPENFDYPQEKTHTKMGNVWVVNFVVDLAGRLAYVMIYHPSRPFPATLTTGSGRKARNEAYRATWYKIRPAFFDSIP